MKSSWTPEKQAIATLRNWVIALLGALSIGAILFFHYSASLDEGDHRRPSDSATEHQPEKTIAAKVADDPVALFTLVLCIFTGGLFWATRLLWTATRDLVVGADATAQRQLRAYIFVDGVILNHFVPGQKPHIEVKIINVGQTPALDCALSVVIDYPFDVPYRYNEDLMTIQVWGQGFKRFLSAPWDGVLSDEIFNAVKSDEKRLYVSGAIQYVDIFGVNRTTKYRYEIHGGFGAVEQPRAYSCREGNNFT